MAKQVIRSKDLMSREVLTIDGMATAKEAAEMMRSHRASELLVAKRNEDDAWGIVTIMDLVKNVLIANRDASTVLVYEMMTKPIITIPADMDIRYAIRLIQNVGVRRAPVEQHGDIVGVLTLSSLILDNDLI
jgi:CBS domain-containing protein